MRPSVLGNPFSHQEGTQAQWKVGSREEAVAAYRPWLKGAMRQDGAVLAELRRIAALEGPVALICCCAPLACHASVIADAVRFLRAQPQWQPQERPAPAAEVARAVIAPSGRGGRGVG